MKPGSQDTTHIKSVKTPSIKTTIYGDIVNVTWRMLAATLLGVGAGYLLDQALNSSPIMFLFGAGVGLLLGIVMAFRIVNATKETK